MVGHGAGLLFFSAVAGYWVLERAETHKGNLRRTGRFLGWLVIISSFLGVICSVCYATRLYKQDGTMGLSGFCPFSMKAPAKPAPTE